MTRRVVTRRETFIRHVLERVRITETPVPVLFYAVSVVACSEQKLNIEFGSQTTTNPQCVEPTR